MGSQLNEGQQNLFNFIMKYAIKCTLNERNDLDMPDPLDIFLSAGAGIRKSFLANLIAECLKKKKNTHTHTKVCWTKM